MNTRYVILPTIFLAVLCLGSASNAMAQSVAGGGTFRFVSGPPSILNVAARSGPNGPEGIVQHSFFLTDGRGSEIGTVVDLCVEDNEAKVVAQVTQSSLGETGHYIYLFVRDNGNKGDEVELDLSGDLIPCEAATFLGPFATLVNGNIIVMP